MIVDASLMLLLGTLFTLFGYNVLPARWLMWEVPEAKRAGAQRALRIVGALLLVCGTGTLALKLANQF